MKKALLLASVILLTTNAMALTDISIGVYGGLNMPIVQDDAKSGTGFGLKAKFAPSPIIGFSAFFESRSFGDAEITVPVGGQDVTMTSPGGKISVFGAEGMIGNVAGGVGPHFYWMLGISNYKWTRDGYSDLSKVGYHLGPGVEIGFPSNIGVEAKAKFEIVPTDGGGSRKNILIFLGANYHFGLM